MDATVFAAPPPGSAQPGSLYADLQSKTLWLGVDAAVNPAQAVLISDMVALQSEIDGSLVEAKAYTDTKITTRAPTVHTHTAAQITDFTGAVTGVVNSIPGFNWVRGMIMIWSGSLAEIGVGALAGWALCDGSNGTPNLRDRFLLGAGNKAVGSTNPAASFNVAVGGAHTHTINGTILALSQIPSHNHAANTGYMSADHSHYISLNTGIESADHTHGISDGGGAHVGGSGAGLYTPGPYGLQSGGRSAAHTHLLQGSTGGSSANHYHSIAAEGGGGSHTHTESFTGDHTHAVTSAQLRDSMPYYALAFIMKL